MKRTYDECPHCGDSVTYDVLYAMYVDKADYDSEFTFECRYCKKMIVVEVQKVPEFSMTAEGKP